MIINEIIRVNHLTGVLLSGIFFIAVIHSSYVEFPSKRSLFLSIRVNFLKYFFVNFRQLYAILFS